MSLKTHSLLALTAVLVLFSFQGDSFGDEKIFPDWVRQSVALWVDEQISDAEFLALIENVLEQNLLPNELDSKQKVKHSAKTVINDIPELYESNSAEIIPYWVKDRAEWWIDGKITDEQFLRTIHYLRETGYLEYDPQKNIFSNNETLQSSLEKFLLTEKEILNITKETKWRILSTEYEFEEKEGVVDSVKILFTDITRVYEPVFYKFKVPSLEMQIYEFNNQNDLENYWNTFDDKSMDDMFDSAYLKGNPNEKSQCLFNYSPDGAITLCVYEDMIIQVIIFDQHGEHYDYDTENLFIDENEPTTRFSSEILKKIGYYKNDYVNHQLHNVLANEKEQNSENEIQIAPKSIEPETSVIQGITNFSCNRDDFGLVTISGQYNNDGMKRAQVNLIVSFLDNFGNSLGETTATFIDLNEFESKRFVGHSKWAENFQTCQINIE